ncbi:MAG: hypothetical protein ACAH17_00365 [Candidatus Paceibacterota bacterium]
MSSDYIERLIAQGARPLSDEERKKVDAFEKAVQEKVIPKLLKDKDAMSQRRQMIATHSRR